MIAIGSDHAGFRLKQEIIKHLNERNIEVMDLGCNGESCDYPEIAKKVCTSVRENKAEKGILCCGTGIGMSIAANKMNGIRAAVCSEHFSVKYTRLHNNTNVLCLGERTTGAGLACELVDIFVDTEFEGGRHQRRVDMITKIEEEN